MEDLPLEIFLHLTLYFDFEDIELLSQTSHMFHQFFQGDFFWKEKTVTERPQLRDISWDRSWKELYLNSLQVWGFGDLGIDYTHRRTPERLPGFERVTFKQVAAGADYTLGLDLRNQVWILGNNLYRQLGTGDKVNYPFLHRLHRRRAKSVHAGARQTMLIDFNDNVWACGINLAGQLGLGHSNPVSELSSLRFRAKQIAIGSNHTLFIDLQDQVWSCGCNFNGQLGLGDRIDRNLPTLIPGLTAKVISVGDAFSALIDLDDSVWVFGWNKHGQLGLPQARYQGIEPDHRIERSPVQLPMKAKRVSTGGEYLIVVDLDGRLWSCGCNYLGQLGQGDEMSINQLQLIPGDLRIKEISSGVLHTLAIDTDQNVWGWGGNYFGQLGLNDTSHRNVPTLIPGLKAESISVGASHSLVIALIYRK